MIGLPLEMPEIQRDLYIRDSRPLPAKKRINAKAKGSKAEHRCMEMLTGLGYSCCRSAASLGAFDVIAVNAKSVLFIQVKVGVDARVGPGERKNMLDVFMPEHCCHRLIWLFHPGGKWSIFKLTEGDVRTPFLP